VLASECRGVVRGGLARAPGGLFDLRGRSLPGLSRPRIFLFTARLGLLARGMGPRRSSAPRAPTPPLLGGPDAPRPPRGYPAKHPSLLGCVGSDRALQFSRAYG